MSAIILRAIQSGAITAGNAEAGFVRIRDITNTVLDDTTLARTISACLTTKLIHEPIRLQEGALHCHLTLKLTEAGRTAARTLIEK